MIKLNDRVVEVGSNIKGVVIDIDKTSDLPFGVLFEDVDEDKGIWWCSNNTIKKDMKSDYDIEKFIKKINSL